MAFNKSFNDAFQVDDVRYVTVEPNVFLRATERPEYPPYSKLWERYAYPLSPVGLLLWQTGEVKQVASFYDSDYLYCDDAILGGHKWAVRDDSWQAQVLQNAGFTLIECEPLP